MGFGLYEGMKINYDVSFLWGYGKERWEGKCYKNFGSGGWVEGVGGWGRCRWVEGVIEVVVGEVGGDVCWVLLWLSSSRRYGYIFLYYM